MPARPEPLFAPYRALGVVTAGAPPAVARRGTSTFCTASAGRGWVVYDCARLTVAAVGPLLPHTATALAAAGDVTLAACGARVVACDRVHVSGAYLPPPGTARLTRLLVLGDTLLALARRAPGTGPHCLVLWTLGVFGPPARVLEFPPDFVPTELCHPPTYVDKVVVGGRCGSLQLWNVKVGAMLHVSAVLAGRGAVRALVPSPALDVLGVGLGSGAASLVDMRTDELVACFEDAAGAGAAAAAAGGRADAGGLRVAAGGACTALAFSTCPGPPLLAAGGAAGSVALWDLEARRLAGVLPRAHAAHLTALHFFEGEPRLQSAGADNALRQWVLDPGAAVAGARALQAGAPASDAPARLLRERCGHAAPPALVRHYGADGTRILSAGADRTLRLFSAIQDAQSREFGQGGAGARAKRLKISDADARLPRVVALDSCEVREKDWANVLTAHAGDPAARAWSVRDGALAGSPLAPPPRPGVPPRSAPVTAVSISRCGNFALVGSEGGHLDRYNMQSGLYRGSCVRPADEAHPTPRRAHTGAVTGLAHDAAGRRGLSVGLDGGLRVWTLRTGRPAADVAVGAPVSRAAASASGRLLAAACEDATVRVFDVDATPAPRLVRSFPHAPDRVADLTWAADGRWLLAACLAGGVRVLDVPAGITLQVIRLGAPVVSASLAPTGDALATAHAGRRGVFLWSNQALFGSAGGGWASEVPVAARMPRTLADGGGEDGGVGDRGNTAASGPAAISGALNDGGPSPTPVLLEDASDGGAGYESSDDGYAASDGDDRDDEDNATADSDADPLPAPYDLRAPDGAPAPVGPGLATTSLVPRAQWLGLTHLDDIKERNKPVEPPKKPEAAPFFLPTVPSLAGRPVFAVVSGEGGGEGGGEAATEAAAAAATATSVQPRAKRARATGHGATPDLALLLADAEADPSPSRWDGVAAWLRAAPPSAVDAELTRLAPPGADDGPPDATTVASLASLLAFVASKVEAGTDWELVQAFLAAAVATHGRAMRGDTRLRSAAASVAAALRSRWARLDALMDDVLCGASYVGGLPA